MIGQNSAIAEQVSAVPAAQKLIATPEELAAADQQIEQRLASRRSRPRRREISGHDEAALSWHFGQGLAIYEKSTFGPIVYKIALDGYTSNRCGLCKGQGTLEKGGTRLEERCPTCEGSRWRPHKKGAPQEWCITCAGLGTVPPYKVETAWGWCEACGGTGSGSVEKQAKRRPRCHICRPEPVVERSVTLAPPSSKEKWVVISTRFELVTARVPQHCCWNCYGSGDEPLSAQPVMTADTGGGVLANDSALTSFAITSRRLDKVKRRSPVLHEALGAFYGDSGARWALSDFGRFFALYHLTNAGMRLVRWETKALEKRLQEARRAEQKKAKKVITTTGKPITPWEDPVHLLPQEAIWTSAIAQQRQPHPERRKLLDQARQEAHALYQRAADAWLAVTSSKTERDRIKRLAAELEKRGHQHSAAIVRLHGGAV